MKNTKVGLYLILSQIGFLLFGVLWAIVAMMSFMMFDQPEALKDPVTLSVFLFVWLYPVGFLGSMIASWILYHKRKFRWAAWINSLPLIWVLVIGGTLTFL
jgi:hypothetical protein